MSPNGSDVIRWRRTRGGLLSRKPRRGSTMERDQRQVLIVEDERQVREVLYEVFLLNGYKSAMAPDGRVGLELFKQVAPSLVITDVRMPVMDGLDLLRAVRQLDDDVAVIILTGVGDVKTAIESLKLGAYDFIIKPVNVEELLIAAERALERRSLLIEHREYEKALEARVKESTLELANALRELQETYRATLEALGSALDTRDIGTEAHSRRVHGYAMTIADRYGVKEPLRSDLDRGVLLHDIGKIGIPDAILRKPGPLTPEEWKIMRTHPELGKRLLERVKWLQGAVPIVYHHHERWDGGGYPLGLKGADIPLGARIFSVVDAFDAMTFDRPYSKAISIEAARKEIDRCSGTQFDPVLARLFLEIPPDLFDEIRRKSIEE